MPCLTLTLTARYTRRPYSASKSRLVACKNASCTITCTEASSKHTGRHMAHEEQGGAGLQSTPLSWWQQLLSSLTHSDKLSLFRTSKWLAGRVVGNSPHITVHLQGATRSVQGRRDAINVLLEGCEQLSIEADEYSTGVLAVPGNFSKHVATLSITWPKDDTLAGHDGTDYRFACSCDAFVAALESFTWNAFVNVHELRLRNFHVLPTYGVQQVPAIPCLCKALLSGALPNMRVFHFNAHYMQADIIEMDATQRLATALAHRITHLYTNVSALLAHVQQLTNLRTVDVFDVYFTADTIVPLLGHRTLHTVTIGDGCDIDKSYSNCKCTWQTLILAHGYPCILEALPWKGLHEVKIVGKLIQDDDVLQTLHAELFKPGSAVVVEPHDGKFEIHGLGQRLMSFVEQLRSPCELQVHGNVGEEMPIPVMWAYLPECVHTVRFVEVYGSKDWQFLWWSFPGTVKSISLWHCNIDCFDLQKLVVSAPWHLKSLHIVCTESMHLAVHGLARGRLRLSTE